MSIIITLFIFALIIGIFGFKAFAKTIGVFVLILGSLAAVFYLRVTGAL